MPLMANWLLTQMSKRFMISGYKILWIDHAITELSETIEYLEKNWTEKELWKFSAKLDHTIELISKTPEIFPDSYEK